MLVMQNEMPRHNQDFLAWGGEFGEIWGVPVRQGSTFILLTARHEPLVRSVAKLSKLYPGAAWRVWKNHFWGGNSWSRLKFCEFCDQKWDFPSRPRIPTSKWIDFGPNWSVWLIVAFSLPWASWARNWLILIHKHLATEHFGISAHQNPKVLCS